MPIVHRGLPVKGYKQQTQGAVDRVNRMKAKEEEILRMLDDMAGDMAFDQRWLAIGRTGIEQAFMAINRSVFRPERVALAEDQPAPQEGSL